MTTRQQNFLKVHPEPMTALLDGIKTSEVRINDSGFQIGDDLLLAEFDPHKGEFTGVITKRTISHIQAGCGLPNGYVCLSFEWWQE